MKKYLVPLLEFFQTRLPDTFNIWLFKDKHTTDRLELTVYKNDLMPGVRLHSKAKTGLLIDDYDLLYDQIISIVGPL